MAIIPQAVAVSDQQEAGATIQIAGVNYREVLKLRVHRDMQEVLGEGEITLSWPGAAAGGTEMLAPAFMDGVDGAIMLDGQLAMTFKFDTRTSHGSPTQYELELHFRGKSSPIVDGSPKHETGEENDKTVGQIIQKLMEGYDVTFVDKSKNSRQIKKFIVAQGETVERASRRAAREFAMNFFEDETGTIVLTNKDEDEGIGGQLVLGDRKITHWSVKRDISPRFSTFNIFAHMIPTDEKYGKAAEFLMGQAAASEFGFQKIRDYHVDGDHDQMTAKDRAGYEGSRSAAQGLNVTLRVSTWTDVSNKLWKLNQLYPVSIPIDGVNETLLLSSVTFVLTPTERYATLVLTSANSFGKIGDILGSGASSMTERFTITMGPRKPEDKKEEEDDKPPIFPPPSPWPPGSKP